MVTFWTAFPQAGLMIIVNGIFQHQVGTSNPTISINPTSGPVFTTVTVTGNGFDPISIPC